MKIKPIILGLLALGSFSATAFAGSNNAVITWGPQQDITGDSDIFTGGTLINAFALGGAGVSAVTIGAVTFQPFVFPPDLTTNTVTAPGTIGTFNFTESNSGYQLVSYNNLGSNVVNSPFSGLSPSYQSLLSNAGGSDYLDTLTLTITGLTVGQDYVFQFFTSNSSNRSSPYSGGGLSTTADTAGGFSVALTDNTSNADGGLGQFTIGTFTAASDTQTIDFTGRAGSEMPTINAFQLSVVPEPSSIAMLLIGLGGLGAIMRFRHSRSV